jgi:hypothetical protein
MRRAGIALALTFVLGAERGECSELPAGAAALLTDVERIVSAQETAGWFVDHDAIAEVSDTVMESVCRTPVVARDAALQELERRHSATGDAQVLFRASGRVLTRDVERALTVERQLAVLQSGIAHASECPFWVDPERGFLGRQTDSDRFTISLETGGNAQLRQTDGSWTLGGGGLARLLPGWGLGGRFSVLAGFEFGGGAMLKPRTQPTEFVINYFPAIPVVFRIHDVAWHYDAEAAPVALFQADDGSFSFGLRGGFGIGVSALRTRNVLPWGGVAIAYEHYFPSGGRSRAHFIRGGLRVGIVWDP